MSDEDSAVLVKEAIRKIRLARSYADSQERKQELKTFESKLKPLADLSKWPVEPEPNQQ